MPRRHSILGSALVVLLVACSPASPVASGAGALTPEPSAPTTTGRAFDEVIAQIGPTGDVSVEMALQAFALAVAPLPGVTPPTGAPGGLDADAAVAWVEAAWAEVGPEQRAAIERALAPLADPFRDPDIGGAGLDLAEGTRVTLAAWAPRTAVAALDCGLSDTDAVTAPKPASAAMQPYLDMLRTAAVSIAGHLRRPALSRLAVCLVPEGVLAGPALARVFDADSTRIGLPDSCSIFLDPGSLADIEAGGDLGYLMAFETFVCFARTADPNETIAASRARKIPPWAIGGAASWAAATVAVEAFDGGGSRLEDIWVRYLTAPETGLSQRWTDAIGFFAQVDGDQPSAWDVLDAVVLGADSLDSFYAATGRRQSFIDRWAAGYFRDASRGVDWDIVGPAIPTDTAEAGSIEIANGEQQEMAAPSMAVSTADLSTSADITVLAGNHLRVHDGVQDLQDVRNQAYCTKDGGGDACACPEGSPGAGRPPLPPLGTEAKLALTGMESGGTASIVGLSLEDYCGPQPSTAPASGIWSMVYWSPDLGDGYPPILVAYTCDGLESVWKAIYLPSTDGLTRTFEMDFAANRVSHLSIQQSIPRAGQSSPLLLQFEVDFELDPVADLPVIRVSGTKTETADGRTFVFPPRDFGSDAPLTLRNVSLETQLEPYPRYQHPFRAQALAECGE